MTTHKIIHAWGAYGPDSVTGRWSANTFYDESAKPYVPLAAVAAAYEDAAVECEIIAKASAHEVGNIQEGKIRAANMLHKRIRSLTPSDALAALERERRKAKNEALEEAALRIEQEWPLDAKIEISAAAIRAMKEPEE